MSTNTPFNLVSGHTAKQTIDASRAYKELVKVRKRLSELGGSMSWKEISGYTYLVQRDYLCSRKVRSLGAKSPELEALFANFTQERLQLQAREKALAARIELHERMNKAVRAGDVPTSVMNALAALEAAGLSDTALWLGEPALEAYAQSAGIDPSEWGRTRSAPSWMIVIVEKKLEAHALHKVKRAKGLHVAAVTAQSCSALIFQSQPASATKRHNKSHETTDEDGFWQHLALGQNTLKDLLERLRCERKDSASFEQVVIGKNGKMGLMRTADPLLLKKLSALFSLPTERLEAAQQMVDAQLIASNIQEMD